LTQKVLSCAYRTGQIFGVNYLIDVLRGKDGDRIRRFGHDRLRTFGVGRDLDGSQWRSVIRQLVARGYLTVDVEGHGSLLLTQRSGSALRGEERLELRRDRGRPPRKRSARAATPAGVERESPLWDALRLRRKQLAEQQGVPPYVIFHDSTLIQMVELRPATREQFAMLSGVGQHKLTLYADPFLEIIRDHPVETG